MLEKPFIGDVLSWVMSNALDGYGRLKAAPDVLAALDKMEASGAPPLRARNLHHTDHRPSARCHLCARLDLHR